MKHSISINMCNFFNVIYLLAALGLRGCSRAFCNCGGWGRVVVHRLLIVVLLLLWSVGSRVQTQ